MSVPLSRGQNTPGALPFVLSLVQRNLTNKSQIFNPNQTLASLPSNCEGKREPSASAGDKTSIVLFTFGETLRDLPLTSSRMHHLGKSLNMQIEAHEG